MPDGVCVQLSGDMTRATAGSVQIHLEDCRAGVLQVNNRSVEEALAKSNMTLDGDRFFDVESADGQRTITEVDTTCPPCRNETDNRPCCGNGRCVSSACVCNPGWFTAVHPSSRHLQINLQL